MDELNKSTIEDKLSTIKYNCDNKTHLVVNQEFCKNCHNRSCTHICPAHVYTYNDSENCLDVEYENCLECGACKIVCQHECIEWSYPKQGCGVIYSNS